MTTVPYIPAYEERESYLNAKYTVASWLLTKDHKRIAILYILSITFFFAIGGAAATMLRLELINPQGGWLRIGTYSLTADGYNKMFTLHGVMMVFFFLIPSIPATLGNFLVPLMLGAKDLAFPKINLLSWYLYIIGASMAFVAMVLGGVDTGWTFYAPYSTTYSDTWVTLTILGIFINGFSSILTGLNFIVTIHKMRAPGLTWFRPAAVLMVDLRHERDLRAGYAGSRDRDVAAGDRTGVPHRHLRPADRWRPDSVPAHVLVLQPPGCVHYDPAQLRRGQ